MVRFVLDASTAKPASLPRWVDLKAVYGTLFVDERPFEGFDRSMPTDQVIGQLLKEHISQAGYCLIHDFNQEVCLVPAPRYQSVNLFDSKYKPLGIALALALNSESVDPIAYQPKPFFLPEVPASFEFSNLSLKTSALPSMTPLGRWSFGSTSNGRSSRKEASEYFANDDVVQLDDQSPRATLLALDRIILDLITASVSDLVALQAGVGLNPRSLEKQLSQPEGSKAEGPVALVEEVEAEAPGGSGGNTTAENALIVQRLGMTIHQPVDEFGLITTTATPLESMILVSESLV